MNKLISNYLFTLSYQILIMITPLITIPYVSRVLQPEGVGIDAYVTSVVQLFILFSVLSIPLYGSKQIAIQSDNHALSKEFFSIFIIQATVSIFVMICYIVFLFASGNHKALYLANVLSILASTLDISWYFIGKEQIKKTTLRNLAVKILGIGLIFAFVRDDEDLLLFVFLNAITLFVGQLIMWVPLLKELKFLKVGKGDITKHVKPILILFIPQLMIQIYVIVNRIILGNVSGETEVGFYAQSNKIIRLVQGIVTSIGIIFLPRMATEFLNQNIGTIKKYISISLQFVLITTIPMTFGLIAITPNFVNWFFGADYIEVNQVLMIMSPVIIFVGLANVFGIQTLIATDQQNKYSISIAFGAICSLIVNFLLVKPLAATGTTIALLVAEGVGAVMSMYFARKYFNLKSLSISFLKYLSASLVMFFAIYYISPLFNVSSITMTIVQILIGTVVYLTGLVLFKDSYLFMILDKLRKSIKRSKVLQS
ncbi:oligosaccharide flippase family protein [Paenibacillus sp. PDC88]|uniref:oligosaccharide flippase family protein n=1 Tax=Paenibacillus sp. PDC88 TaxID=1884375 RepID=UPI00089D3F5D|nr:oligosaccharide flippase family protein [Paenibacillus sp. PDC88]SDX31351.1 Membrane protein involved in the export of O-antigen and teichoic acid [Paenibacillus sp. PDC88]